MDLRRLVVFNQVYETRSFTRAAQKIPLSQPTVSGHVKSLEDELNLKLFDRLGRDTSPTPAADLLYTYSRRIEDLVQEASETLDAFTGRYRGNLKLGGSTIPGQYVLPAWLGRFKQQYPEIKISLSIAGTGEVADAVLRGDMEMGMVGAVMRRDGLEFTPLMEDQVILVAWPDHPLAGRTLRAQDLTSVSMVLRESTSGTRAFSLAALEEAGLNPSSLKVVAEMGSSMAVIRGVRSQVGIGFVSRRAVEEDLDAGRLVELKVDGVNLVRNFYLVSHTGRTLSPGAVAFREFCLKEASQ